MMYDTDFIRNTKDVIRWGVILTEAGMNRHNILYNRIGGLSVQEYKDIELVLAKRGISIQQIEKLAV
jgi:hypothetical protein